MGAETDFAGLEGWPIKDFGELFEHIELERRILGSGYEITTANLGLIRARFTVTISQNWHLWEPGSRHGTGDRGGFRGMFEDDAYRMARRITRPLEHAAQHLDDAQAALAKFPALFYKHMDPYLNPSRRAYNGGEGFGDAPGRF